MTCACSHQGMQVAGAVVVALALGFAFVETVPAEGSDLRHFVFFGLERERVRETSFLDNEAIAGAQLKYTWRELEPMRDRHDFDALRRDLAFLDAHGKRLFVQLQDVSFDEEIVNLPDYLLEDPVFGGGVARKMLLTGDDETTAKSDGWVARRWDPAVRDRFVALLDALGGELDGRIEGLTLAETSIDFGEGEERLPAGFTYDGYVESVKAIMSAARQAFPHSHVIQYANFMPGEWLPWDDRGYLRAIYEHASRIGIGVGGPDLLPHRKGQRSHSYPLIAVRCEHCVAGVAVQWGNLDETNPETGKRVTVAELIRFARDDLRLDYLFWGTQEPYYTDEILPYLRRLSDGHEDAR